MIKNRLIRVLAMTMAFAMVMAMAGCVQEPPKVQEPTGDAIVAHIVKVVNRGGTAMSKCRVQIYTDATKTTQIYQGVANTAGEITFAAPSSDEYVAVISKLPKGYRVEEQYALTGERTDIVLVPGVMDETVMDNTVFSLGDAMPDFELTLPDGSELKLSDLLSEKKAVVLNFWFMNCPPCKMEFPYIQEGYEQLSDDIAVLAMNPVDSTAAEVAKFQADNGYTFTMSKSDPRWQQMFEIKGFPTTVVIDRYSNICLIHTGGIESAQEFLDMINYFIQDDYEQNFFKSAGQIPAVND